jgi:hypothetical protein
MNKAVKFSSRDRKIVLATIHLWKVNAKDDFIPDYEIQNAAFELSPDEMRGIRDVVQEAARATKNSELSGIDSSVEEAALAEIVRRGKLAKKIEKEIR